MLYRIRDTGAVLTQGEVRKLYSDTSFPAVWDRDVCDFIGVDPVLESPQPTTTRFQSASQTGVVQDELGNWIKAWTVTDWDQEAIDAAITNEWSTVRNLRTQKLSESDWTQLPDAPVDKTAWSVYRQSLRDITTQADPFNITWPVSP